jgi:hypothetical protein
MLVSREPSVNTRPLQRYRFSWRFCGDGRYSFWRSGALSGGPERQRRHGMQAAVAEGQGLRAANPAAADEDPMSTGAVGF